MYDPTTGEWRDEELETSKRLTGLLAKDNDYMQQAATEGKKAANRRGLLNSTMAVTAVEDSRIRAALPIASQDSSQANQRYLQGRDLQGSDVRQQRDITANRQNLELELGSRERLQLADNAAQRERLGEQLSSQERLALQDLQAAERRLGISIGSEERMQTAGFGQEQALQDREIANRQWMATFDAQTQQALQGVDLASRERMQQQGFTQDQALQAADIASRERLAQTELEGQRWLAQFDATTRERLQGLDNATRMTMQQLDIEAQQRIADMNVSADERNNASRLAASFELGYMGMLETIMNNPEIPAESRQEYFDHANTVRESNLALIEQFFGVDLEWEPA